MLSFTGGRVMPEEEQQKQQASAGVVTLLLNSKPLRAPPVPERLPSAEVLVTIYLHGGGRRR